MIKLSIHPFHASNRLSEWVVAAIRTYFPGVNKLKEQCLQDKSPENKKKWIFESFPINRIF